VSRSAPFRQPRQDAASRADAGPAASSGQSRTTTMDLGPSPITVTAPQRKGLALPQPTSRRCQRHRRRPFKTEPAMPFPLRLIPKRGYRIGGRRFGADRSKECKHALQPPRWRRSCLSLYLSFPS
jgi:hypothetical protein